MIKISLFSVIVSVNFLSIWLHFASAEEPYILDLNSTRPTWPPFLKPSGLFDLVQGCENFCDWQFPPTAQPGGETFKAVIGCHKGCYSYELFKVMSKQSIDFDKLDMICSANCMKDFIDEDFTRQFCTLGCSRMNTMYSRKVKELREEYVAKFQQQEKGKKVDSRTVRMFEKEAEKKIRIQQDLAADEIAGTALLEYQNYQKEYGSAQTVNIKKHRRGLKKRIFHVLRFVMESSKYRPYVEIQRINTESYDYGAKDTPERENTAVREKQREEARSTTPAPHRFEEQDCRMYQRLPTIMMLFFVFGTICSAVWIFYGEPMGCMCCLGDNFWERMANYFDDKIEPNVINGDLNSSKAHDIEKHVQQAVDKLDYTCPPSEKDAPPPYVEIEVLDCSGRKMEK